jgi:hypothetical protein
MKEARAVRKRGLTHTVEIRRGDHVMTADEPRKEGGNDEGPSPQELLAASRPSAARRPASRFQCASQRSCPRTSASA